MGAKKVYALENLRCEARTSTKLLSRGSEPELKDRRSFIRHTASFGGGLAGSVMLRATAESRSGPESPSTTRRATRGCDSARRRLPAPESLDGGDQWVPQAPSHGLHAWRRVRCRLRPRSSLV